MHSSYASSEASNSPRFTVEVPLSLDYRSLGHFGTPDDVSCLILHLVMDGFVTYEYAFPWPLELLTSARFGSHTATAVLRWPNGR